MNHTVEIVGYLATVFLVISFLPRNVRFIRTINFFACLVFVVYGVLLGLKWPIIISNGLIALIQLYHLFFNKKNALQPK
ncbi:uroporphyrinogen decarboxylase [Niabella yanshanensis]|uniref:Uroporphyrinogen decarboxylase n=1 Tax=Niabella yanshanensis TaxID=577386 RepID=A0ABZ0W995_9BACT|nr:uroporphyrinogen decarboxylase [Niabella yanshanensis]WQD39706.1 uroporphyrinogen decarboxylase [Niabella yanshanensis]